jgi:hypothetical protein
MCVRRWCGGPRGRSASPSSRPIQAVFLHVVTLVQSICHTVFISREMVAREPEHGVLDDVLGMPDGRAERQVAGSKSGTNRHCDRSHVVTRVLELIIGHAGYHGCVGFCRTTLRISPAYRHCCHRDAERRAASASGQERPTRCAMAASPCPLSPNSGRGAGPKVALADARTAQLATAGASVRRTAPIGSLRCRYAGRNRARRPCRSQACVDDATGGEVSSWRMATSSVWTGDVRSLNASIGFASVRRLRRVSKRIC